MSNGLDRIGAVAGIFYLVLVFVGIGLVGTPDLSASDAEVARFLRDVDVIPFVAGSYVVVLAMLCLVIFAARLRAQLRGRDAGGSWLPDAALAAATVAAVVHVIGTVAPGAAIVRFEASDPQLGVPFVRLGTLANWTAEVATALLFGAAGLEILRRRVLPAWLGRSGCSIALALWATIPLAATGIPHIPATLGGVWILVTGIVMIRRPRPAMQATGTSPSPASSTIRPSASQLAER